MEANIRGSQNERRAYHRSRISEGTLFVRNSESANELGSILDISLGGLSFVYSDNGTTLNESNRMDIASVNRDLIIYQLPYQNVNDFEYASGYPFEIQRRRRRGIRFCDLTSKQLEQIKMLLLEGTQ